ncbi:pyruvate decarboxylase [Histoplasma capsulatum H143]|uniref:Pyruvate decarboxylase n=1 Tax=Ajellomyces capsulatus (strain H143) TaxID=544712 RepID=C6HKR0_AJECH|nr:pyruvate decarboxylase [Histoplasma capsulatum H143]
MSVGDTIQRQMPATVDSPARMGEPNTETIQPTGVKAVNGVNGHSNGHSNSIDLAEYLFRRLYELGIRSVHGLPGDYNLVALDYLPKVGLDWVGNANELNAGYAADGYARVKGVSAMITTFGVGELSAINAVAGAYSEYVPVIHIVGSPSTASQKDGILLHHTLGDGNFEVFAEMSRRVSCAVAILDDPSSAAAMVDNVLRTCILKSRPVYISLPTNMVQAKVDGDRLKYPIDLSVPPNDHKRESHVVDLITKLIQTAQRPALLVDLLALRHHVTDDINELITKSNIPTFVTPMGKGAVDETLPQFQGIYVGEASTSIIREHFHASDLVLSIGPLKSDINTGCFTSKVDQITSIEFHAEKTIVGFSEFPGVRMKGVLRRFQLTAQELSTIIRHKLTPTIFIICNNGYVIERYVHGMHAAYNDIQPWKFNDIAAVFGATPDTCKTFQIRTCKELQDLFNDREFCSGKTLKLVELYLPGEDAPMSMKMLAAAAARRNAKK